MIDARRKGIEFEQNFCKYLKELGYTAESTRAANRKMDNKKVDIQTNAPFYFQLKRMERLAPGPVEILKSMPIKAGRPRVLVHKLNNKPTTVTLFLKDFEELLLIKK